ncbi:hypothetical protein GCM10010401_23500 [Rarobacter faecitabidus]|uniref:Ig-like domain-containing protein n=1 Tax=Rarobacter faecitabidus TaxID=13243 RepID=A0A542ZW82_RARFA|nr:hypothetical protein [Rarobacter faecitabidus]TQL64506.1 hypothetical protein FB461_1011 [Rarobacter faecitabidus]
MTHLDSHPLSPQAGIRRSVIAATILALLLTVGLAVTATSAAAAAVTETEPNNSIATAQTLALGDTLTGKTLGTQCCTVDSDYYYVPVSKPGRLNLSFTFPANLSGDAYDVKVFDAAEDTRLSVKLIGRDSSGAWASDYAVYVTGNVYIQIHGRDNWNTWNKPYQLRVTHTPGTVEREPNNSIASATSLPLGTTIQGSTLGTQCCTVDSDYYYVPVSKPGRLNLSFTFPANLSGDAYDVKVFDAAEDTRLSVKLIGRDSSGAWASDYAVYVTGNVYIQIHGRDNWNTWGKPYTLRATHTPGTVEREPNNSIASATMLPRGTTIQGSILGTQCCTVDTDYFYVPHTKSARLAINLRFPARLSGSAYDVAVYNSKYQLIQRWSLTGKNASGAWGRKLAIAAPRGGTYIQIHGRDSWNTWGKPYTLRVADAIVTKTPKIAGTKKVRKKLTAKPGKWSPAKLKYSYQWYRNGKKIKKAKKKSYKLTSKDRGKKITVKVTAKKAGYFTVSKKSKPVKVRR